MADENELFFTKLLEWEGEFEYPFSMETADSELPDRRSLRFGPARNHFGGGFDPANIDLALELAKELGVIAGSPELARRISVGRGA